ncbi:MAG: hypothetical protein AAFV53_28835 [Myxococcota bacterium]
MGKIQFTGLLTLSLSTVACAPPVAPAELQELACFLFEHADDEDDEYLQVGLQNLSAWLDGNHEEDIEEGYQIQLLTDQAVQDLNGTDFTLTDDLVGAAVAHRGHRVRDWARATTVEDWEEIIGEDQYEYYTRDFIEGEDCILERDCLQAEARSESELVQLGVSIISKNYIQYRWVEFGDGEWGFIHRSWLTEPPTVSSELVEPNAQYFLAASLPKSGGAVRVQATWIDTKIVGINVPKNQVVKTMRDQGDAIDVFLDAE